jgi:hypothetical protein
MKKLLLITVLLVLITTKSSAQENKIIELKKIENNQFKIKANEEMNINLRYTIEQEDYNVLISNSRKKIIFSRNHCKGGKNKIAFTMDEGEQYIVKFSSDKPIKLIATTFAEN